MMSPSPTKVFPDSSCIYVSQSFTFSHPRSKFSKPLTRSTRCSTDHFEIRPVSQYPDSPQTLHPSSSPLLESRGAHPRANDVHTRERVTTGACGEGGRSCWDLQRRLVSGRVRAQEERLRTSWSFRTAMYPSAYVRAACAVSRRENITVHNLTRAICSPFSRVRWWRPSPDTLGVHAARQAGYTVGRFRRIQFSKILVALAAMASLSSLSPSLRVYTSVCLSRYYLLSVLVP